MLGRIDGTPVVAMSISAMVTMRERFPPADLSRAEVRTLQQTFTDAYRDGGGPAITDAARTAFAARFAVRDVLDTLTALGRGPLSDADATALRGQLRVEIRLLREVLGWQT
jgi:hypothetical protein